MNESDDENDDDDGYDVIKAMTIYGNEETKQEQLNTATVRREMKVSLLQDRFFFSLSLSLSSCDLNSRSSSDWRRHWQL